MNPYDPRDPYWSMLRTELTNCLGGGQLATGGRAARPEEIGGKCGNSGSNIVPDGTPVTILNVARQNAPAQGCGGMATVHISVEDVAGTEAELRSAANGVLILEVQWQSGLGGGSCEVDATQGSQFVVGGANVISVKAFQRSSISGEALVPWATKRVEGTVHWDGSVSARGAYMSLPSVSLNEGPDTSDFFRIPRQSMSMLAWLSDADPATAARLTAEFATADDAAAIKYRQRNPNANGTAIYAGVEFVRFDISAGDPVIVFPHFELWI